MGEKLGDDIVIIKIKELSSVTDYVVICGASSDRQVKTLSKGVQDGLLKASVNDDGGGGGGKEKPLSVEGERVGQWVLMDYGNVVVHIFLKSERERYDLEGLWVDAPRVEFDAKGAQAKASAPVK